MRVRCVEAAGAAVRMSDSYCCTAHWPGCFTPLSSHQPVMPRPASGSDTSSTCSRHPVPEAARLARARPQPWTRRACSSLESSTYAGWRTSATAVSVCACGSCSIAAPVSSSMRKRRAAASPGRASVPPGRGADGRARYFVWPLSFRTAKCPAVGSDSTAGRPCQRTKASAMRLPQSGAVRPAPVELPRKIDGTKTRTATQRQRTRDAESPRSRPRRGRRPNRTVIGVVVASVIGQLLELWVGGCFIGDSWIGALAPAAAPEEVPGGFVATSPAFMAIDLAAEGQRADGGSWSSHRGGGCGAASAGCSSRSSDAAGSPRLYRVRAGPGGRGSDGPWGRGRHTRRCSCHLCWSPTTRWTRAPGPEPGWRSPSAVR